MKLDAMSTEKIIIGIARRTSHTVRWAYEGVKCREI
jgi:hypothetical protein